MPNYLYTVILHDLAEPIPAENIQQAIYRETNTILYPSIEVKYLGEHIKTTDVIHTWPIDENV